jgi:hypothetical protein
MAPAETCLWARRALGWPVIPQLSLVGRKPPSLANSPIRGDQVERLGLESLVGAARAASRMLADLI